MLTQTEWEDAIGLYAAPDAPLADARYALTSLVQERAELLDLLKRCKAVARSWSGSCCPDPKHTTTGIDNRCPDCLELAKLLADLEAAIGEEE